MCRWMHVLTLALIASVSVAKLDVMLAVQKRFYSGCVYLLQSVNSTNTGSDQRRTMLKTLSGNNSQWAAITFNSSEQIRPKPCIHNKPLLVFLSSDEMTRLALVKLSSERGALAEAVWLLFLDTRMDRFLEEVFIPINCEFLVARRSGNRSLLFSEVYRMRRDLPLQQRHFGSWHDVHGLRVSEVSLVKRRTDFHGIRINVTSMKYPPFIMMDANETVVNGGFFGVVWDILERKLNFKTDYIAPEEKTWGIVYENMTTTGIIKMLYTGKAEVAVFNMLMTSNRMKAMDFTIPLLYPAYHIFIRRSNEANLEWDTYLAPFSRRLWLAVVLLILLISLFLPALYYMGKRHGMVEASVIHFRVRDSLFIVFGAFCQQGMENGCPQFSSCRVVYMTTYLTAVILLAAYSATLVSFLTVQNVKPPFSNLEEILQVGTHKLGALKTSTMLYNFMNATEELLISTYNRLLDERHNTLVDTIHTGLHRVCHEKYLLMAMYADIVTHMKHLPCSVVALSASYFKSSLAMGLQHKSPYKPFLNYQLLSMIDDGVMQKQRSRLIAPFKMHGADQVEATSGWVSVEMKHLLPILTALGAGIILGAAFLGLEIKARHLYFRCRGRRLRYRRRTIFSPTPPLFEYIKSENMKKSIVQSV